MVVKAEKISRTFLRNKAGTNFFYAVQKTDFQAESGELIEIVGKSGSGKSTFLNMLAGLLTPTDGKVYIGDTDLYLSEDGERSQFRNENIGVIPQGQTGLLSLTVLENVLLPSKIYGKCDGEKIVRAEELLKAVGLYDLKDVYPNELSGGEMRRMAIARALIMQPSVILADEPTGDLDEENTALVMGLLKKAAKGGAAVIMVTHDKDALSYADKVYSMSGGVLSEKTA